MKKYFLRIVCFVSAFIFCLYLSQFCVAENKCKLNFFSVIENPKGDKFIEYEPGKNRYPNYRAPDLSDTYLIKKTPDVFFTSSDVISIIIEELPCYNCDEIDTFVKINFSRSIGDKLKKFTEKNFEKLVAIEFDGKILSVSQVYMVVDYPLGFVTGYSCEEIFHILKKLTTNIELKRIKKLT